MCLLIGPAGVGKTLLLKRLQAINFLSKGAVNGIGDPPTTIPTVGTNLVTILTGQKNEITVRELGGSMGPIWHNYLKDTDTVIYMIDLTNRLQVSAACIQLLMLLSHSDTKNLPFLLLFNKIDVTTAMTQSEVQSLFRMNGILKHAVQKINILEISAKSGNSLDKVVRWINSNHKQAEQS
ncbi:ADP-ribosylation factor-like protein 16 isoform X2 [Gigantopelta aegis]|uniref:ADP-ribosylation factor-like protein 16 isoform X2 n=1 Tax=Gigantopelta aegis TaxID=1735272 RepID=UPI001B88B6F8|nr:ADP-ribosylation factor-like protein 16 isoform X2 [Gigantopelta aegis]